jgi:hypothetical protein
MKKQAKITFIYSIGILLGRIKSGFACLLLSLKNGLANLAQQKFNNPQLLSFPDKIGLTPQQPFKADAQILPLKFSRFSPEEVAIDEFFSNIQFEQVKEELNSWFFFGLARNGKQIAGLSPEQVEYLKTQLPLLISVLYDYHRSTRKEASNGG